MVHTRHFCKKIGCAIGHVSGLVLFIIGVSTLPQRPSITLEQGQTIDDSNKEYNSLVLHSSAFYIMISGISLIIVSFILLIYIVNIRLNEELLELERREVPRRSALRVARVLPVPEASKVSEVSGAQIYQLSVPHKGPVIQVLKKFRYPPPYEAFNQPSAP